jgi:undecaprenyl-diphosphatase
MKLTRRRKRRRDSMSALGDADRAALRFLRTRGHGPAAEAVMKALATAGEYGAVWVAIGAAGAALDSERRQRWLAAAAVAPVAVGLNFAVKSAVRRQRPALKGLPPLGPAPTQLSFPSAHATSSLAAATAIGRVRPGTRPALFALAAALCVSRPYLGMHYPSDVLAGAALGVALGKLAPGVTGSDAEERLIDLVVNAREGDPAFETTSSNGSGGDTEAAAGEAAAT